MSNSIVEQIDIDNREFDYSNDGIYIVLKDVIEYKEKIYDEDGEEVDLHYRLLTICYFIGYLTDEKLLNITLDYLKMFDLFEDIENTGIDLRAYSEIDITKIKAIYYSLTSLYNLNIKNGKFPNSKNPKQLDIKLKNRVIEHNLPEVLNSIRKNNIIYFKDSISKYLINIQKNKINEWIRSALDIGHSKETKMFDEEINHLKEISDHLIEIEATKQIENNEKDEKYKTQNLFKVGLLFATGEMNKYYTINNLNEIVLNDGLSPLKIATELKNKSFEKWILASKNNYKTDENKSKNIFNNLDMMNKIIAHCKTNNLSIDPYFIKRLPTE